jgi:AcrR family transcriptional regulator
MTLWSLYRTSISIILRTQFVEENGGSPLYQFNKFREMKALPKATKKEIVTAFRTQEILAAARRLLDQRGPEAMTMEEIAAAAGVAKGTLYLYFQSKDELIQAMITQVGENILRDVESSLQTQGTPAEKLIRMVAVLLEYLNRERLLFPIYARELLRGKQESREGFWRHYNEIEEKFLALVTTLFAEGIATGQFIPANPRLLTFLLRGLVRATGYYQRDEGQTDAAQEALPVILTLLSSGLIRVKQPTIEEAAL